MVFSSSDDSEEIFADADEFDPSHLPDPGPFLDGHDILTGDEHVEVHKTAAELFEERGVYDMTFGYNLANLNVDTRHPDAGFRYATERDDPTVLRVEFSPTTEFCPQGNTLAKGAYRAWNGLSDRHAFSFVRVRVAPIHDNADEINEMLAELEREDRTTVTDRTDDGTVEDS